MKRLILFLMLLCQNIFAVDKVLNVYNWANFMPNSVIKQFERETGIHVNYMEYDSNELLYAKLKTNPNIGFDVIVPSSYVVQRMAREGMLHVLDPAKIPNIKNLNPFLMNREFDPHNQYSLPYMWGTTAIVVNQKFFNPQDFNHWTDLWDPKYKNQLLLLDDMREVFSVALIVLGYSVNETNPEHIREAYEKLRALLPNIKLFNNDAQQNIYVDEDATLGIGYNGDIYQVQQENPRVTFVYPKDPFTIWIDCISIPKNAPHLENAFKFLNFINRPDMAAKIAENNGFSSPNSAAFPYLPKSMQQSTVMNPPMQDLKRSVMENDVGNTIVIYEKYWELLKLGT